MRSCFYQCLADPASGWPDPDPDLNQFFFNAVSKFLAKICSHRFCQYHFDFYSTIFHKDPDPDFFSFSKKRIWICFVKLIGSGSDQSEAGSTTLFFTRLQFVWLGINRQLFARLLTQQLLGLVNLLVRSNRGQGILIMVLTRACGKCISFYSKEMFRSLQCVWLHRW